MGRGLAVIGIGEDRAPSVAGSDPDCAHPVVDVVLDPGPQPVVVPRRPWRVDLRLPALHDFGVHGPQTDALVRHQVVPVLADLGADVGQPYAHPAGQIFQRPEVDPLVHGRRAGLGARHGEIGYAVRDHRQGDGGEDEIALLDDARHLLEERVEVGQRIARGEPRLEIVLDLLHALAGEVLDRMERLRLVGIVPADRPDEQLARPVEASELVEMAVDVVGEEGHGVVVGARALEGAAGVDTHEQGETRLALGGFEAAAGEQKGDKSRARHQAAGAQTGARHWLSTRLGCSRMELAMSRVSMMSFRLCSGRLITGFDATRIMTKFRAAARTCRKGIARYSRISWHLACSQSVSRLKSTISSLQQLTGSGPGASGAGPSACASG